VLEEISSRDHSAYDALIVAILSHGNKDGVYGINGEKPDSGFIKLDDITALFDGSHCRSLQEKPKMFFIQACQGGQHHCTGVINTQIVISVIC